MAPVRLFVGDIPSHFDESLLKAEFSHYGDVKNVEIKEKKGVDDGVSKFAFVALEADHYNVNKCVEEFSRQDLRGYRLKVSIAKESFMDRLKREREEASSNASNMTNKTVDTQVHNSDLVAPYQRAKLNSDSKIAPMKNNILKLNLKPVGEKKRPVLENHEIPTKKFKSDINTSESHKYVNNSSFVADQYDSKMKPADVKRLESLKNMKADYNMKKKMLQSSLASVDKKSTNKILFDDDGDVVNNAVIDSPSQKGNCTENSKINYVKPKKSEVVANGRKNINLFNDDSEHEEEYNFEMKEQLEGKAGQKLMELQSRYKSDKRFVLDERFLDENEEDTENKDATHDIDGVEDSEKFKQMEILDSILGTTMSSYISMNKNKKSAVKTMLRFDPTRTDHNKFINIPEKKENQKSKKSRKESTGIETNKETTKPAPVVPNERYYKVEETLKTAMEDKKPFSLLSLFGGNASEDKIEEEYSVKLIEKKKEKIKNPADVNGGFFYDSSDDDKDQEDLNKDSVPEPSQIAGDVKDSSLTNNVERLFFTEDDVRLKEGLDFFLNNASVANESRNKLKSIVKKRIRNNVRNEKYQAKKSGPIKKITHRPVSRSKRGRR